MKSPGKELSSHKLTAEEADMDLDETSAPLQPVKPIALHEGVEALDAVLLGAGADDGEAEKQDMKVLLAQQKFLMKCSKVTDAERATIRKQIENVLWANNMSCVYQHICKHLEWTEDAEKLASMQAANAAKVKEFDERVAYCEVNMGDVEVRDTYMAKADYLINIGDKAGAQAAYDEVEKKTSVANIRLTIVFNQIRLEMLMGSWSTIKEYIVTAKTLCEQGGDWEKKNRLMIYEAVFCVAQRDFKAAAKLFLDSVATFTTYELFNYEQCIFYAVVTSIISLPRTDLKTKVVEAPEVLTIIHKLKGCQTFLNSLYYCNYPDFFPAFLDVIDACSRDMLLHAHVRYYMREVRVVAYSQFLESYKSVTLAAMAAAFGFSPEFMDSEISTFIVEGRLAAKIDKVANVIETNRTKDKHNMYQQCIKQGDALLNRIQKLSKIGDVE